MPTTTRAAVMVEHGKPIQIDEVILPDPGPHHVIVKQFASGVCHSQLRRLSNPNQAVPSLLGHESTGVVIAKGSAVSDLEEGDHVMISLLPRGAQPGMEPHHTPWLRFRGQEVPASFAAHTWMETVISDERWCIKIDPDVPTDVTSVVGCAVQTGAGAVINTANVKVGDSVAVYGVGGVGLCAVQACANVGAFPIIAVDLTDEKLEHSRKFGATHLVNARREDPVQRVQSITGGGADFAFDIIGTPDTITQILPSVRAGVMGYDTGGTAVLVGVPQVQLSIPVRDFFGPAKKIMGCAGGTGHPERDIPLYLRWFQQGKLPLNDLVTRRYKLEEVNEACDALARGQVLGRAILEF